MATIFSNAGRKKLAQYKCPKQEFVRIVGGEKTRRKNTLKLKSKKKRG